MKKLAVLGLCLCLFPYCAMTAFAEEEGSNKAVISASVPSEHTLTVIAPDGVDVNIDGKKGDSFDVDRLSEPTIAVNVPDGQEIKKIVLNGEDITDEFVNGLYTLPPVYESLVLSVETTVASDSGSSSSTDSTSSTSSNRDTNSSKIPNTYPNNSNPNTGDAVAASIGVPAFFLSSAFIIAMLKKRNKEE